MIVFLKREPSLLDGLAPYLEASGDFTMARFGEERIPMGELWIDACIDCFTPEACTPEQLYPLFSEIHSVLELWNAAHVRLLLSRPIESGEPFLKKTFLFIESFTRFYGEAYHVWPLFLPLLLEENMAHPAAQIIRSAQEQNPLTLLWTEDSTVSVMRARECADTLLGALPEGPCIIAGRSCTLKEIEEKTAVFWGKPKVLYENAYGLGYKHTTFPELGSEEEPLESLLMSLL